MSAASLDQKILVRYDRRKQGFPTEEIQPGAHTGTRDLLETTPANIVFVNFSTGDDGTGDGSSGNPFKTYAKGVTEVGSTSKTHIEWQTNGLLSDKITVPTQASIGVVPTNVSITGWVTSTTSFAGTVSFNDVATDKSGTWVAVGADTALVPDAAIYQSTDDGDNWTIASTIGFTGSNVSGVASDGAGTWIAVGTSGEIGLSTDGGDTWTLQTSPFGSSGVSRVNHSNGVFVACTSDSKIASSSDGVTWSLSTVPSIGTVDINDVVGDGSGNWIAATGDATDRIIKSSDDGATWSTVTTNPSVEMLDLAFLDGNFYSLGTPRIGVSTDNGDTWTDSVATIDILGLSADDAILFYTQASPQGYITDNGTDFHLVEAPLITNGFVSTVSDFNGTWVGVGDNEINIGFSHFISESLSGFNITGAEPTTTLELRNCTASSDIISSSPVTLNKSKVTGDVTLTNAVSKVINTLAIGDVTLIGVAASEGDILVEFSTIIGNLLFTNSGGGLEQIQNTIVQGNVTAVTSMTFQSGNLFNGALSLVVATQRVSFVDPLFIDAITFRLQRETGYTDATTQFDFDSPLIALASDFLTATQDHQNSQGVNRDFGAWSFDDSSVILDFTKKHLFPKPANDGGIVESFTTKAIAHQAEDGSIDVANDIDRQTEEIVIRYAGIEKETFEFAKEIERLRDTTVFISLEPDIFQDLPDITVDGIQSIDDVDINIDAKFVPVGSRFEKDGVEYFVLYVTPNTTLATQLILSKPLESALADDEVIDLKCPKGIGEYKYVPPTQRSLTRVIAQEKETGLTGFSMRFIRKCL